MSSDQFRHGAWKGDDRRAKALVVFDYCLTLQDEIQYMWNCEVTAIFVMFHINRYIGLVNVVLIILEVSSSKFISDHVSINLPAFFLALSTEVYDSGVCSVVRDQWWRLKRGCR